MASKIGELCHIVDNHDVQVVLLQETWLDGSTEYFSIPNFIAIGRRDHSAESNRGGVLCLVRSDPGNFVFLKASENFERI